jgi:hypothetical protein
MTVPVLCLLMGVVLLDAFVRRCLKPDPSAVLHISWSVRCTICTQIEPSPTTEATRLTLLDRASPTQNTPGTLLSMRYGGRGSGHLERLYDVRSRGPPSQCPALHVPYIGSRKFQRDSTHTTARLCHSGGAAALDHRALAREGSVR